MGVKIHLAWLLLLLAVCALHAEECERDADGVCLSEDEPCFLEDSQEASENKYSEGANVKEDDEEEMSKEEKRNKPVRKRRYPEDDYPKFEHLSRLDGVKVGHVRNVDIDGWKVKMITRAMKPLLFEIPNALSSDEADALRGRATDPTHSGGLFSSKARGGLTPKDLFRPSTEKGRAYGPAAHFENWDENSDGEISKDEIKHFARQFHFLYFNDNDVQEMLTALDITDWDDDKLTKSEFRVLNTRGIEDHFNIIAREHPKHRQRTSDQTWLPMAKEYDKITHYIRWRFGKLFKIPEHILLGSEHMQVVRYTPGGHYHAHHDSETEKARQPCCHQTDDDVISDHAKCKLCRFITVMTYLNDPEEGGETAFPAADNITFSDASFRRVGSNGNPSEDLYNLEHHCYDSNLYLKPKKGTSVAWYNHHVDPKTGWMGALDDYSLHGGCTLKKGEKWIMNMWLTAPYEEHKDRMSMYSMEFMEMTNFSGRMNG